MGAVVNRQTIDATGKYLLVAAGTGAGTGGWQIGIVGSGWTGSGLLKNPTSAPGSTLALGSAITYYNTTTGLAATAAITSSTNVIVQDIGSDLYFDYTHTAGTVTITVMAAGELIGSDEGFLTAFNPAFTGALKSVTALATPSALTATQFTAFASTVSGATLMGFGTTGDVTLKNRAGTSVAYVGPNTTKFWLVGDFDIGAGKFTVAASTGNTVAGGTLLSTGDFTVGASTFVVTAATGAADATGRFSVKLAGNDTLSAANAGLRLYDFPLGVGLYGQQKVSSPFGYFLQVSDPTFAAFFPLNLNSLGGVVNIASAGVQTTVGGPLAITGALTGVTTAAISGDVTGNTNKWGFTASSGALGVGALPTATSVLHIVGLPVAAAGLAAGDVWSNGGVLTIV